LLCWHVEILQRALSRAVCHFAAALSAAPPQQIVAAAAAACVLFTLVDLISQAKELLLVSYFWRRCKPTLQTTNV